ncbi:transmembrane protein 216-like [Uranotaenia lowii]|uniref:transmembrane protein 216-like n=1 Tax=Uranotaenia lowii TaxID=190385 RepID=UPI00247B07F5|nr:transmembrane protein 216-like [Uranotaenia lowii]XP_055610056.1 transmembrane protein 216-like [Uranotaenia lowii]
MGNPSLTYEILLYLNSFYFGLFAACELGMMTLKAVNLQYPQQILLREIIILVALCVIETVRIILGRKGSLSDHGWQVILSVFLTIPCAMGVSYLLFYQLHRLRLEYILCALMLSLQTAELMFAILFVFSLCRPTSYD